MIAADREIDTKGLDGRVDRLQKLREDILMLADEYKELCRQRTREGINTPYRCPMCELDERMKKRKRVA